ncbi:MAG: WbqC family protein [Bacteroidota bacterium]
MTLSTQYFPSIPWIQEFLLQSDVQIEQWENYQKQGLMNRCKILGAEGVITLSVPLLGGREQKSLVRDLEINNISRWNIDQQRAIKSCYSKSPFFEHYFEPLENLLTKKHKYLLELNMEILQLLRRWFAWNGNVSVTNSFEKKPQPDPQSLIPNSKSPTYIQVFSDRLPFTPGLSVLDALFCLGPQAKNLIQS